jgi:hypothetical protein
MKEKNNEEEEEEETFIASDNWFNRFKNRVQLHEVKDTCAVASAN